jgi:hypothetical protein
MDVDPGEKARRVGRLTPLSERARSQRQLPPCGRQGASERARHLRRAAAGEEKERRDDEPARRRADAALGMVLRPRIACYLHGLILVCSQRGVERKGPSPLPLAQCRPELAPAWRCLEQRLREISRRMNSS